VAPVFAQSLSDRTGLKTSFDVHADGDTFVIETVANFDIQDVRFEDGKLVLKINSSLENNIGELQIPQNVTKGQIYFTLDGNEILPKILQNEKISFVTLEFQGNGTHTIEITSDYTPANIEESEPIEQTQSYNFDPVKIVAVVGIVIAIGVGSTLAYYFKTKSKTV
jgi:hypothetical protein